MPLPIAGDVFTQSASADTLHASPDDALISSSSEPPVISKAMLSFATERVLSSPAGFIVLSQPVTTKAAAATKNEMSLVAVFMYLSC